MKMCLLCGRLGKKEPPHFFGKSESGQAEYFVGGVTQ